MSETHNFLKSLLLSGLLLAIPGVVCSATFTLVNQCSHAVWPGILSNADSPQLSSTGFVLNSGDSVSIYVPSSWHGRLWGRTICSQDHTTGIFNCITGDCGSGKVECGGNGAEPPATLVEFTLNGYSGFDFYDVSLVDGFNLPVLVVPQNGRVGGGNCTYTGCNADLNAVCPPELKVVSSGSGDSVACRSACEAFRDPRYCCSGEYGTPETCGPTAYSEFFKNACPRAYSYAYDDGSSIFTCASSDYAITFCPPLSPAGKKKSSEGQVNVPTRVSIVSAAASLQFTSILIIFVSAVWQLVILTRPNICGPLIFEVHTTQEKWSVSKSLGLDELNPARYTTLKSVVKDAHLSANGK